MAIPGTREYYDEFMAKKRAAAAAAAAAGPQIDPASVGLDVQMVQPTGTAVQLVPQTMPSVATPVGDAVVVIPQGQAPAEPPHGADGGEVIRTGGSGGNRNREAALASMRARGLPIAPELSGSQQLAAAEGTAADQYEQAGLDLLGMQGAQRVSSVPNREFGITKDYVDTSRDVNSRQMAAQQAVDDAAVHSATAVADELEVQNDRQRAALVDMQARHYSQEEAAIQAQERTRRAYDLVAQATDRLAATPDIDPNRAWANKTAGQRFRARITMIGRGLLGQDPQGALNAEIERDIDAQKASFAQRASVVGARQGQLEAARSLYADIRSQTQDEREADEIFRIARLEQAKTALDAISARSAIPSIQASQAQFRLQLEQQIADRKLQLGKIAVHNVRRKMVVGAAYRAVQLPDGTVVRVPVGGAGDQARAKYLLAQAGENRADARKVLGTEAAQSQQQAGDIAKLRTEAEIDAQKPLSAEQQRAEFTQRAYVEKESRPVRVEKKLIEDFMKDYSEDIPGFGTLGWFGNAQLTDDQQRAYNRLVRIVMMRLRPESGAAISDSEIARESGGVIGGVRTDNSSAIAEAKAVLRDLDETDIQSMLKDRLDEANFKIDLIERAPSDVNLSDYLKAPAARKAALPGSTVGVPDPVQWEPR